MTYIDDISLLIKYKQAQTVVLPSNTQIKHLKVLKWFLGSWKSSGGKGLTVNH